MNRRTFALSALGLTSLGLANSQATTQTKPNGNYCQIKTTKGTYQFNLLDWKMLPEQINLHTIGNKFFQEFVTQHGGLEGAEVTVEVWLDGKLTQSHAFTNFCLHHYSLILDFQHLNNDNPKEPTAIITLKKL